MHIEPRPRPKQGKKCHHHHRYNLRPRCPGSCRAYPGPSATGGAHACTASRLSGRLPPDQPYPVQGKYHVPDVAMIFGSSTDRQAETRNMGALDRQYRPAPTPSTRVSGSRRRQGVPEKFGCLQSTGSPPFLSVRIAKKLSTAVCSSIRLMTESRVSPNDKVGRATYEVGYTYQSASYTARLV